ncbi:MAG: SMP-30/gluconolactonase/LRE family protein [Bacteroidetes bacterium]|nr:SMP-30/gluconolactonase/LRE family protein [Bacteroidota bacterium]
MRKILLVYLSFAIACSKKDPIILPFQPDLIPEGIAIDSAARTLFLSSLHHSKIVTCSLDGTTVADFIATHQYHFQPGFGMTIKGDTLYALGNSLPKGNNRSILLLLSKSTGALIRSFAPRDSAFKYLNDLAVARNGDVYITDSENNKLYTVKHSADSLHVWLESDAIANSNGIAISPDDKYLYLASDKHGIRIMEIATKRIMNEQPNDFRGIDGMKYYRHSLIAIANGNRDETKNGVYRYFLNETNTAIVEKKLLLAPGEDFVLPTTFAIVNGFMYFVIDSQLGSLDGERNQIIDSATLKKYTLLKLKI